MWKGCEEFVLQSAPFNFSVRCLLRKPDVMLTSVQVSSSTNFPSRLRDKLRSQTQTVSQKDLGDGPVTEMECPRCSNMKATWSEAQLRSADEGSTIFYCCMQCKHRYLWHIILPKKRLLNFCSRWSENN